MTKLDESQIIAKFQKIFGNQNFVMEDVELFKIGRQNIIAKVDTLVQSTDIPSKMSLNEAARKSIVACVSDFAAKGARPQFAIISVNLPAQISKRLVSQIAQGFKRASREFGVKILGGDTNQGKEVVFNVCMFGSGEKIVKRKGAKVGDLIFASGPFGITGVGLEILLKNIKTRDAFAKIAIKSVLRPIPRLEFGLKSRQYFSSSMDSSDGLSTTLNEMAKQSKCKFVINNIPTKNEVYKFAKTHKSDFESLVFHTGEEYEIVFTVPKRYKTKLTKMAQATKTPIIEIGSVLKGRGVYIKKDQKLKKLKDLGYRHFS